MEFLFFVIGLALLIKAADYFVDASVDIAKIFGLSEIIIGATIVSIGTTLPEVMVSSTSALKGHGDIAYGNAIGSIICNTSLIAAISLVFAPGKVNRKALKVPTTFFFIAFIIYATIAVFFGQFTRLSGLILISIFVSYVAFIIYNGKMANKNTADKDTTIKKINISQILFIKKVVILIVSAVVIAFASNLLVDNGTIIAKKIGVPESVIGLTMIALGTSLPELTTAITSLVKGHSNLSLGNIIGANFFNIVLVSGIAITIAPFKLPESKYINGMNATIVVDIPLALFSMMILCLPTIARGKTSRFQGIMLLLMYFSFLVYQFIM